MRETGKTHEHKAPPEHDFSNLTDAEIMRWRKIADDDHVPDNVIPIFPTDTTALTGGPRMIQLDDPEGPPAARSSTTSPAASQRCQARGTSSRPWKCTSFPRRCAAPAKAFARSTLGRKAR